MKKPDGIRSPFKFLRQRIGGDAAEHRPENGSTHPKLIVLIFVSLVFSTAFSYLLSKQPTVLVRSDHFSRWYATYKLVAEHRSLYDPQNGREIVALNSIPFDPIEGSFFYPAYLTVFTLPLARLPYPQAHFIWLTLIQLFLISGIGLIYHEIKWPASINQFTLILFLSVLFIPNLQNTIWGQFNTIAVISLALVYLCLRRQRYLLAGITATGMAFKPQQVLLTLLFLLGWALFQRERWRFFLGFGLGMFTLWLTANLFEPNWVGSFIRGVKAYDAYLHPNSALDLTKQPGLTLFFGMALLSTWFFMRNLASKPNSISFAGCIVLSLGVWWLAVPVLGMMHLAALPIAVLLLFAGLGRIEIQALQGWVSFIPDAVYARHAWIRLWIIIARLLWAAYPLC